MKNITLAVDDATYLRARRRAAERGTSVSGLVRELLQTLDAPESSHAGIAESLFAAMDRVEGYVAGIRPSRDETHDRGQARALLR